MRSSKSLYLVLFASAVALAGCGQREGSPSADSVPTPLKIGFAAPFTGPYDKQGDDMWKGDTLAIEQWNARGGVLGRSIELIRRDDEGKHKQSISIARELVNEGVIANIGHYNSGCTIPSSEIFAEKKIPIITPASTNPKVTDRG